MLKLLMCFFEEEATKMVGYIQILCSLKSIETIYVRKDFNR